MTSLLARVSRKPTLSHVQYVSPVHPRGATGLVASVYEQAEREFGMLAPPLSLHSPAPGPLAAAWVILRETLIAQGKATRAEKELIATAVSLANECPYCVDVHGTTLIGITGDDDARTAAENRIDAVADPYLRSLAAWAKLGQRKAPFSGPLWPELAGVAVTFHYYNRMVNVFLPPSPFPPVPSLALRGIKRVAQMVMGAVAGRDRRPGEALRLLPPAPVPGDIEWALASETITDAFARAVSAVESAAVDVVPAKVRALVQERLSSGTGNPGLLSGQWLSEAVATLSDVDKPAGRLAMLIAFSSYRITPQHIQDFRDCHPDDAALVAFCSWVSLTAARHIGARLFDSERTNA